MISSQSERSDAEPGEEVAFRALKYQYLFLNLKLRADLLELEKRIMQEVAEVYRREDLCRVEMDGLEERTAVKERCSAFLRAAGYNQSEWTP